MDKSDIQKLTEVEASTKSAHKRLDTAEEKIEKLENTYAIMEKMDYRMGKVEQAVERIDCRIVQNTEKKGMKWDKLIDYLFYALLAYALLKLGIK